jgi:hypothetical protein
LSLPGARLALFPIEGRSADTSLPPLTLPSPLRFRCAGRGEGTTESADRLHGYDERLAKKVHITRAANLLSRGQMLKHPAVILHELAHAYHDQVLGFDEPRIVEAYKAAMKKGLYDKVLLYTGDRVRHYAATNHKEYFAEGTESFFYRNDFYPFVAAELEEHDPRLYKILEEIWGPLR